MSYNTSGRPVGQDMITAAVAYNVTTNRLDYSNRGQMRSVGCLGRCADVTDSVPLVKVIVNAPVDTTVGVAALFALAAYHALPALRGGWFLWDPKRLPVLLVNLDEGGDKEGAHPSGFRVRTIDFLPVDETAGGGSALAVPMEILAIPCA